MSKPAPVPAPTPAPATAPTTLPKTKEDFKNVTAIYRKSGFFQSVTVVNYPPGHPDRHKYIIRNVTQSEYMECLENWKRYNPDSYQDHILKWHEGQPFMEPKPTFGNQPQVTQERVDQVVEMVEESYEKRQDPSPRPTAVLTLADDSATMVIPFREVFRMSTFADEEDEDDRIMLKVEFKDRYKQVLNILRTPEQGQEALAQFTAWENAQ